MLYTKRNDTAGILSKQISSGEFQKEYLALLEGHADDFGRLEDFLFHDSRKNKTYIAKKERKGVRKAALEYETIKRGIFDGQEYSLVKVKLLTGRTHQIRAQFASRKLPLLGDGKYGARDSNVPICLYCHKLEFLHPRTKKKVEYTSLPDFNSGGWKRIK